MNLNSKYRPNIGGLWNVAVLTIVTYRLFALRMLSGPVSHEIQESTFTFTCFYKQRTQCIFRVLFAVLAVILVAGYLLLLPNDYAVSLRRDINQNLVGYVSTHQLDDSVPMPMPMLWHVTGAR